MIKRLALAVLVLLGGIALPLTANSASAQTGGSLANTSWVLAETAVQRAAFVPALGTRHRLFSSAAMAKSVAVPFVIATAGRILKMETR